MQAVVLDERGLSVKEIPAPEMQPGSVRVAIIAGALNRRDQWIREGMYAKIKLPHVPGSDGCGVVLDFPGRPEMLGRRVVIDPSLNWGDSDEAQGPTFQVLGMPSQGTLAQEIIVPADNVHLAPEHLSDAEAAALPLAGVTAWRALMLQGQCKTSHNVLITGIGGGVAVQAMQFAIAHGAHVWVSSTSNDKIDRAIAMGARGGVNVKDEGWVKQLQAKAGTIDVIVDSVGGPTVNDLLNVVRPGGTIVFYGSTLGVGKDINMHRIFWKQLRVIGSTMGTAKDFADMLAFVDEHGIHPVVDSIYEFSNIHDAYERMMAADHLGKVVITPPARA